MSNTNSKQNDQNQTVDQKEESNKEALFIYGAYCKIISNEKHYIVLQAKYAKLAINWLMIILAAIGVVFSSKEIGIPIKHSLAASTICLLGITINCFMWHEALISQGKFLSLNILEASRLENIYQWLPKVHHQHYLFVSHKAMLGFKNNFYIGCNAIMLTVLGFSLVNFFLLYSIYLSISSVIIEIFGFLILSKFMTVKSYKNELSNLKKIIHVDIKDDKLEFEEQESADTDFIIDPTDETKRSINYGLYSQLNALKNFYFRIQNSYKMRAMTWLVAAFIGMGFLFSQDGKNMPLHPMIILLFILLATMSGITLLWFLDIFIYQTYFYSVILEKAKLEKKDEWLPNIALNIGLLQTNPKTCFHASYFYIGCYFILLSIMCFMAISLIVFEPLYSTLIVAGFICFGWLVAHVITKIEYPPKAASIRKSYEAICRAPHKRALSSFKE
jgi:hypothetical protein